MDLDMEEGEVLSSSDSECEGKPLVFSELDYNELPRPARPVIMVDSKEINRARFEANSDDDILSLHASATDSDSDGGEPWLSKIKRTINPTPAGAHKGTSSSGNSTGQDGDVPASLAAFQHFAKTYQSRRINNVWADVIQEERIAATTEGFGRIGVDESDDVVRIERGPESFQIDKRYLKRTYASSSSEEESEEVSSTHSSPDPVLNDSESYDISSDGLSEEAKEHVNDAMRGVAGAGVRSKEEADSDNARSRLQKNKIAFANLSDSQLNRLICSKLKESKAEVVGKAIELLGRDVIIHLYLKTRAIERAGGILIKDGSRRRTPGGVFFYLFREHSLCDTSLVRQIFNADTPKPKKVKRRKPKPKRKRATPATETDTIPETGD